MEERTGWDLLCLMPHNTRHLLHRFPEISLIYRGRRKSVSSLKPIFSFFAELASFPESEELTDAKKGAPKEKGEEKSSKLH